LLRRPEIVSLVPLQSPTGSATSFSSAHRTESIPGSCWHWMQPLEIATLTERCLQYLERSASTNESQYILHSASASAAYLTERLKSEASHSGETNDNDDMEMIPTYRYEEDTASEAFFAPCIWSIVCRCTTELTWEPESIKLFDITSKQM
jgi:hypothetical protein